MPKIDISIIVPVYNTESYIRRCMESLVNQTKKEIEIIIVNDGSTDGSDKIIKEYIDKYKEIKISYLVQENHGQAVARNKAIDMSVGEYICFVDSDDYIRNDMCEKLYNKAIETKSDIVVCDMMSFYDNESEIIYDNFSNLSQDNKKNYIISNAGPCAKIIKSSIIKNNKLYFKEGIIYEDLAVVPSYAIFANTISYIPEPLYYYYQRSGSTMNASLYNKRLEDIFISVEALEKEFINNKANEKYSDELEYLYITHLLHDASLRFIKFNEGIECAKKILAIMKNKYPNYKNNVYYMKKNGAYKLYTNMLYNKRYGFIKCISNIKSKLRKK